MTSNPRRPEEGFIRLKPSSPTRRSTFITTRRGTEKYTIMKDWLSFPLDEIATIRKEDVSKLDFKNVPDKILFELGVLSKPAAAPKKAPEPKPTVQPENKEDLSLLSRDELLVWIKTNRPELAISRLSSRSQILKKLGY